MKAVVVYQSLWGNTASVAQAIAKGLGAGAKALSTTEATPDKLKGVDLIVAGSPIHAFNLPSEATVKGADLPEGMEASAAAFDTGVSGPLGRGGASRIVKRLKKAGLEPIAKPMGFRVAMRTTESTRKGALIDGEVERARAWGGELRLAMGG
jgi:flavorubredoxin